MKRPNWDEYFMGLAFVISARSRDIHTKHGSVITTADHRIIATGYNSFVQGVDDSQLPTSRPDKYLFMLHSEMNALLNSVQSPKGGKLYVTGYCCPSCFQHCVQAGIKEFFMAKRTSNMLNEQTDEIFQKILGLSKVKVNYIEPDLSWVKELTNLN